MLKDISVEVLGDEKSSSKGVICLGIRVKKIKNKWCFCLTTVTLIMIYSLYAASLHSGAEDISLIRVISF